ncbi:hypothetical protein [Parageobacillus thermoglucosidasius]|uniref:hypothetical protein n=1 Tax=Parageobacillus thermoglucosidasius TaxID=1426 RepID=UPI000301C8BE|nr:hypothetical protein [Parageobacillus thermoglucosidasius]KYD16581.1 hypothetical protein B4168_1085 [Anoxybacillus flavithermus]OAO88272.1 hypothetical protein GT23_0548 [Parageobacillus thermoglucosidasius]
MKKTLEQEALWEMRFWMQILGDHCRFILESLAEKRKEGNRHIYKRVGRLLLKSGGNGGIFTDKRIRFSRFTSLSP